MNSRGGTGGGTLPPPQCGRVRAPPSISASSRGRTTHTASNECLQLCLLSTGGVASHRIASHRITSKHMTRSPYRYQNEPAVMPYIPEMRGYVHCTNKGGAGMEGRLMLTRGHCWWYSTMTGVGAPHQRLLEVVP